MPNQLVGEQHLSLSLVLLFLFLFLAQRTLRNPALDRLISLPAVVHIRVPIWKTEFHYLSGSLNIIGVTTINAFLN